MRIDVPFARMGTQTGKCVDEVALYYFGLIYYYELDLSSLFGVRCCRCWCRARCGFLIYFRIHLHFGWITNALCSHIGIIIMGNNKWNVWTVEWGPAVISTLFMNLMRFRCSTLGECDSHRIYFGDTMRQKHSKFPELSCSRIAVRWKT